MRLLKMLLVPAISLCAAACSTTPKTAESIAPSENRNPSSFQGMTEDHVYKYFYYNERFGYKISYVGAFFDKGVESDNNDGMTANAFDGNGKLIAYGRWDLNSKPLPLAQVYANAMAEIKKDPTRTLTLNRMDAAESSFTLSGYLENGAKIFYSKSIVKDGAIKTFEVDYKTSARSNYDFMMGEIAKSFVSVPPAK